MGSLLVLPVGRFLVACGGEDENPQTTADSPAAAPRTEGSNIVYSSSSNEGHFHTFAVDMASMASPPAGGLNADTGSSVGHVHSVSVSMAQLASAAAGQSVRITTSDTGGHTHVLTLVKLGPGGGGGGGGPDGGDDDPGPGPYPY